jgi:hypothetical protein
LLLELFEPIAHISIPNVAADPDAHPAKKLGIDDELGGQIVATSSIFSLSTCAEQFSRDPTWSRSLIINSIATTYRLMFFIVPNSLDSAPETIAKEVHRLRS